MRDRRRDGRPRLIGGRAGRRHCGYTREGDKPGKQNLPKPEDLPYSVYCRKGRHRAADGPNAGSMCSECAAVLRCTTAVPKRKRPGENTCTPKAIPAISEPSEFCHLTFQGPRKQSCCFAPRADWLCSCTPFPIFGKGVFFLRHDKISQEESGK